MTFAITMNVILGVALIAALLVLLGHFGVNRDRHHGRRLYRWHQMRVRTGRRPRHVAD